MRKCESVMERFPTLGPAIGTMPTRMNKYFKIPSTQCLYTFPMLSTGTYIGSSRVAHNP